MTTTPSPDVDDIVARLMPRIADLVRASITAALASTPAAEGPPTRADTIAQCGDCDEHGFVDLGDAVARCQHPKLSPAPQAAGEPAAMQRSLSEPLRGDRREEAR
ncbi:hypothetical protein [Mycolicibacterium smegmatis]|uniref:Uncharacterized protein n=1 Tax=Mycolicibacterium smegmatis (strain MKD8) TaxID=1214915 RepID=A0A2U9PVL8_MYCSE|nr:hypothetical protein [Mycolicibacterium smegmatis]AWT55803.1 hypothetical protein D806_048520 [Mycolicibacterium smegmatis MKD8]